MLTQVAVQRVLSTAGDFSAVGLAILGYYLKLYVVEDILNEKDRAPEKTEMASELLDSIEQFKNAVLQNRDSDETKGLVKLIEDQEKAKLYCLNFSMTLYNNKLKQVQEGPWDGDLKRGLWCCVDLFGAILHLWQMKKDSSDELRKRIKYCKLYLSQLNKNQLGLKKDEEQVYIAGEEDVDAMIDEALDKVAKEEEEVRDGEKNNSKKSEGTNAVEGKGDDEENAGMDVDVDVNVNDNESNGTDTNYIATKNKEPSEKDIQDLLDKFREIDDENDEDEKELQHMESEEPQFKLPDAPTEINQQSDSSIPEFIESGDEAEINSMEVDDDNEQKKEGHHDKVEIPEPVQQPRKEEASPPPHEYSKQDLMDIMDHSTKIDKIQKLAKYAISALNYDDTVTAKDQLTEALELLNSM